MTVSTGRGRPPKGARGAAEALADERVRNAGLIGLVRRWHGMALGDGNKPDEEVVVEMDRYLTHIAANCPGVLPALAIIPGWAAGCAGGAAIHGLRGAVLVPPTSLLQTWVMNRLVEVAA